MSNSLDRKISVLSILKFTFPSIIMMVIMSLYTVVDGIFVARLIGTDAFSAVNIVYPLVSLTVGLGTMFGTGATAIVSIKLGQGRRREAKENLTFLVLVSIAMGVVISLISFIGLEPILYFLGADEAVYGYCYAYAFPLIFFFAANILQLQFQCLYVANGKPHIGLVVTILGGVANIVLDYIFIAWFHMGIAGAAVATGIGYSIPALFGLLYFAFMKSGQLHFVRPKKDWRVLAKTVTNGSSEMVTNLSTSVSTLLFNIILMRMIGPDGVAAISILLYLDFIIIAVSMGYSLGVAPLISYNYGRGDRKKLKKLFRIGASFCTFLGVVMTFIAIAFAGPLTVIFADKGTRVYELAVAGLKIYAFSYLFKGYSVYASAMFTAYGDGKVSAVLSFLRTLVFLVASLLLLSWLLGITGIWIATPLAEGLAFAVAVYCTVKYKNKYHYL